METLTNLKTETGRDAREQVIIKSGKGPTAFISFGNVIAVSAPNRATLINADLWDSNQTTLKYLKQWLGKDNYSKQAMRAYLDMAHFKLVSDDVINTIWELETGT